MKQFCFSCCSPCCWCNKNLPEQYISLDEFELLKKSLTVCMMYKLQFIYHKKFQHIPSFANKEWCKQMVLKDSMEHCKNVICICNKNNKKCHIILHLYESCFISYKSKYSQNEKQNTNHLFYIFDLNFFIFDVWNIAKKKNLPNKKKRIINSQVLRFWKVSNARNLYFHLRSSLCILENSSKLQNKFCTKQIIRFNLKWSKVQHNIIGR